jgi:hypothetical protein
MAKLAGFTCQRRKQLKCDALDLALQRMFPKSPVDARRFLRRPLARWHVAATRFLQSRQLRADDTRFVAATFSIAASCPPHQSWVLAMFAGLGREIDAALAGIPADCPCRYSRALLFVVEYLFDDAGRSQ